MTPAFKLTVDGADATGGVADRLLSLSVTDEDGTKADRLEIEIDNRDGRVALPDKDAKITLSLGFRETGLSMMGIYAVDGLRGSGPVLSMTITATAADLKGDIRAPKTRSFENKTLGQIVETIAGEAGLKPVVGKSVASKSWPYLAQTAESNLHFLSRITKPLDATCKPTGGALIVQKRGEGKTAAGDTLTPPELGRARFTDWSWEYDGRKVYRSAEAEWSKTGSGEILKVTAGSGNPKKKLRHVHASEDEARRAAEAVVSAAARAAMSIDATLAGFEPGILAGASVQIAGLIPAELNGEWHVKSVRHVLSGSGLVTSFQGTTGEPK